MDHEIDEELSSRNSWEKTDYWFVDFHEIVRKFNSWCNKINLKSFWYIRWNPISVAPYFPRFFTRRRLNNQSFRYVAKMSVNEFKYLFSYKLVRISIRHCTAINWSWLGAITPCVKVSYSDFQLGSIKTIQSSLSISGEEKSRRFWRYSTSSPEKWPKSLHGQ